MSLTSMLKGKDDKSLELQRILKSISPSKSSFTTRSGDKPFDGSAIEKIPYRSENLAYASITGTAIEMLAKYRMGRMIKNIHTSEEARNNGFAVRGLEKLQYQLDRVEFKKIYATYATLSDGVRAYVKGKEVDFTLVMDAALLSAKLEALYRSGVLPEDPVLYCLSPTPKSVHQDLERLFNGFQETFLDSGIFTKQYQEIIFNPVFGKASIAVGGADGDLFLDGTLYDFKASRHRGYMWQEVAQLMGYALFAEISEERFSQDKDEFELTFVEDFICKIKRIAFYRVRFSEIEYFSLSDIPKDDWLRAKMDMVKLLRLT